MALGIATMLLATGCSSSEKDGDGEGTSKRGGYYLELETADGASINEEAKDIDYSGTLNNIYNMWMESDMKLHTDEITKKTELDDLKGKTFKFSLFGGDYPDSLHFSAKLKSYDEVEMNDILGMEYRLNFEILEGEDAKGGEMGVKYFVKTEE